MVAEFLACACACARVCTDIKIMRGVAVAHHVTRLADRDNFAHASHHAHEILGADVARVADVKGTKGLADVLIRHLVHAGHHAASKVRDCISGSGMLAVSAFGKKYSKGVA